MAFAARQDDDGTHRLCLRKGDTFRRVGGTFADVQIKFSSQVKTKACADELNERFWKDYEAYHKQRLKGTGARPGEWYWEMLDCIYQHDGIAEADVPKIHALII